MYEKRLKICRNLYDNNVKRVGKVYISKTHSGYRRMFYIYYYDNTRRQIKYARYLKERNIGHKLSKKYEIDHVDENTLNDNISNLKIKTKINHLKKHHIGMKRSKKSRKKMSVSQKGNKNALGKKYSESTKMKMRERWLKFRIKRNEELAKKFGQPWL